MDHSRLYTFGYVSVNSTPLLAGERAWMKANNFFLIALLRQIHTFLDNKCCHSFNSHLPRQVHPFSLEEKHKIKSHLIPPNTHQL